MTAIPPPRRRKLTEGGGVDRSDQLVRAYPHRRSPPGTRSFTTIGWARYFGKYLSVRYDAPCRPPTQHSSTGHSTRSPTRAAARWSSACRVARPRRRARRAAGHVAAVRDAAPRRAAGQRPRALGEGRPHPDMPARARPHAHARAVDRRAPRDLGGALRPPLRRPRRRLPRRLENLFPASTPSSPCSGKASSRTSERRSKCPSQIARCSAIHRSSVRMGPGSSRHVRMRPTFSGPHEAAAVQHVEVLHHGRQRHVQRRGERFHGGRATGQADDHGAAALVGERVERPVELCCVGGRHGGIVAHT